MLTAGGSLIPDDAFLQDRLRSARWQKSSTETILLKFGTKFVEYVFYLMLKKFIGVL